jgi:Tfp pilus assembly protein PilE
MASGILEVMLGHQHRRRQGFTVVEILIIIVVIGILAALLIVTYNGIVGRARLTTAQSDMKSFAQSADIFKAQTGVSPNTVLDFSQVLRDANLYTSTRDDTKSFAICATNDGYAFVAWQPVVEEYKNKDILYLFSSSSGQSIYTLTNSSLSSVKRIDKICDEIYPASILDAWTYDIP